MTALELQRHEVWRMEHGQAHLGLDYGDRLENARKHLKRLESEARRDDPLPRYQPPAPAQFPPLPVVALVPLSMDQDDEGDRLRFVQAHGEEWRKLE